MFVKTYVGKINGWDEVEEPIKYRYLPSQLSVWFRLAAGKNERRKSSKAEAFEDLRSNCEQFSVFEHFSCRKFGSTQASLVLLRAGIISKLMFFQKLSVLHHPFRLHIF